MAEERYADDVTRDLNRLARSYEDTQKLRKAEQQRLGQDLFGYGEWPEGAGKILEEHTDIAPLLALEHGREKEMKKLLDQHVLADWLASLPGLGGARTARLIAMIGDPWRFPGQYCSEGHVYRPRYTVGDPCPYEPADDPCEDDNPNGRCSGTMRGPRPGTGVRALWSYLGLFPEEATGKIPRKRRGSQASFSPKDRALILGPQGIADQIVRHKPEPYRAKYDKVKANKQTTDLNGMHIERIARLVASKEFVGDLLTTWKSRSGS